MSKILTELATSVEEKRKRGESNADLFKRIMVGVSELSDDEWNKLSPEAQDYFNDAADAANKKADFPEPPDAEVAADPVKEEPTTTRRRTRSITALIIIIGTWRSSQRTGRASRGQRLL